MLLRPYISVFDMCDFYERVYAHPQTQYRCEIGCILLKEPYYFFSHRGFHAVSETPPVRARLVRDVLLLEVMWA